MTTPLSIRLSELATEIQQVIHSSFRNRYYWVIAEISSLNAYPNKDRYYFDFVEKEEASDELNTEIAGRAWKRGSEAIAEFEKVTGEKFREGIEVLVQVSVSFHPRYGLTLFLEDISQEYTLGALERRKQEFLKALVENNPDAIQKVGEDYLTTNKKARFRSAIQHIAIVGSPNSEGYKDFMHTLSNNTFGYRFTTEIYQSSVQGREAEGEMIDRLIAIFESKIPYDCVVIIRGGGAQTDFQVFNQYKLSRAVARFPIPIITGIGHISDISIVDRMVHTMTNAPTKAAEFIVAYNRSFEEQIISVRQRLAIRTQQLLGNKKDRLGSLNRQIVQATQGLLTHHQQELATYGFQIRSKPLTHLYREQQELSHLSVNLGRNTRSALKNGREQLKQLSYPIQSRPKSIVQSWQKDLSHLSVNFSMHTRSLFKNKDQALKHTGSVIRLARPESILKRGFAIISQENHFVAHGDQVDPDKELKVIMESHDIDTKVIRKQKRNEGRTYL